MQELAKQFIGEECLVYTALSISEIRGIIKEVGDGGIIIENAPAGKRELVNFDYVIHICRQQSRKKGKKKATAPGQ